MGLPVNYTASSAQYDKAHSNLITGILHRADHEAKPPRQQYIEYCVGWANIGVFSVHGRQRSCYPARLGRRCGARNASLP